MNLTALSDNNIKQLTGCNFKVISALERRLIERLKNKRGRPFKHPIKTLLIAALVKLRSDLAYRSLAILLKIPFATLSRYTNKVCSLLAGSLPKPKQEFNYLLVDGTTSRIRSTQKKEYSGYKHHKARKVQAIVTDQGEIVAISRCYAGSVHDTKVWNREFKSTAPLMTRIVLGDKGYAGAKGANEILFAAIRHNELEYKNNYAQTKAYNRELSKIRVKVEHVFAQLKSNKIVSGIFPLKAKHYGMVMAALATIHNVKLQVKNRK